MAPLPPPPDPLLIQDFLDEGIVKPQEASGILLRNLSTINVLIYFVGDLRLTVGTHNLIKNILRTDLDE